MKKAYPAIATLEFRDIATGMYTTDVMVKEAPIAVLKCGTISQGRYLTLIGGSTASVQASYEEGLLAGVGSIIDHTFLPDIHDDLHAAILGKRNESNGEAVGILETSTVSSNFLATEVALKHTPVSLVELRYGDSLLAGKAVSILHGVLHDVEASIRAAAERLTSADIPVSHRILTNPDDAIYNEINQDTRFHAGKLRSLGGESV